LKIFVKSHFPEEMRKARVDWQLVVYGKAAHSFTNREATNDPAKGAAYNGKADRRSWEKRRNSSGPAGAYY
jgi:dienelactone hydrolase